MQECITNIEKIYGKMDAITQKIKLIEDKKNLWGIYDEEEVEKLMLKYLQYYYELSDETFIDYIEPFLYNEDIIKMKSILIDKYKWDGKIYFIEEDIEKFNNMIYDKKEFLKLFKKITEEEIKNIHIESIQNDIKEMNVLFSELNHCKDENYIETYINTRFEIIKNLLGEENIEKII